MKVKLLIDFDDHKSGEVVDLPAPIADRLEEDKKAEFIFDPEPEPAPEAEEPASKKGKK